MENYAGEYFLWHYADFVMISSVPILSSNLSVFHIEESEAAKIQSLNNEQAWTAGCGCQTLNGSSITFQAESNAAVQIVFNGSFTSAKDVAAYINSYNAGAAVAAGWQAYAQDGYVVIESLVVGSSAQLTSLEANSILGFGAPQTVSGTNQRQIILTGVTFEVLSLGSGMYAITFLIDRQFHPGESYYLFANVSPIVLQNFFVRSSDRYVTANFVG